MKTLKITFALLAVLLLTVSGIQSDNVAVNDEEPTYKEKTSYDLLAHDKTRIKLKTQG
ncbi:MULTISPECIES: hypothetical protein [Winogradskyella]|jgi:hypothetical protein|uniref:Uncharacterized protein n=1 Tax=Winogradskyella psychrotolerans RS-3 TaxID=641526 RepID=S7XBE9_9FLAO|nr:MULTISPECIES: hypothetical protein [Winogradskyella]EPR73323.1 hypothetical protein ADIWIN_1754 [Winogradskyella psychrotolerans RS-3]